MTNGFCNQQDIACSALASASWSSVTGGYLGGTERGGRKVLVIVLVIGVSLQSDYVMFTEKLRLVAMLCVCVLQALAD